MEDLGFELSEQKKELLKTSGHLMVIGGPGSGKTTIALLKANHIIESGLRENRKVLFLSFARATISRVEEKAKAMINRAIRKQLEINTYHGFIWTLLKSHGYLINDNERIKLLTPPEAAARLAEIDRKEQEKEKARLFNEEGLLHFDLFAKYGTRILSSSNKLASIFGASYPAIILDEFQDTNQDEWELIQVLGQKSVLIALGDLDQRIYEFRGANPERIKQFIDKFSPKKFDFGMENNRSNGCDIVQFGNDVIDGSNLEKAYKDVQSIHYRFYKNMLHLPLKAEVFGAIDRLKNNGTNWSLAILVPTKNLMMSVSDFLGSSQQLTNGSFGSIGHEVQMEMAGPSLAAVVIARLMEKDQNVEDGHINLLQDLVDHMRGRNGNNPPTKANITLSNVLLTYIDTGHIRGPKRQGIANTAKKIYAECLEKEMTGEPGKDWLNIREILLNSDCTEFKLVGNDAKYLRLLRKGTILNSGLGELWRGSGNYIGARDLIDGALLQEHFSTTSSIYRGVHIMTMHAAKGKEFDEVIIYDGPTKFKDRIVNQFDLKRGLGQKRLALRVAVTRAMKKATLLTPKLDPCVLF